MMFRSVAAACVALLPLGAVAESYPQAERVVSVGGPVTETVYLLGEQDRLVARDTTSVYPPEANKLPDVGYMRRLSAEGVLSMNPDLIIARDTSGPVEVIDLLKEAAVPTVLTHDSFDADAVVNNIRIIGKALGVQDKAEALATKVQADLAALAQDVATVSHPKRVMFILSAENGKLNAAGNQTGADGLIQLAGAVNVMAGQFVGYKIVTDEAVIKAAPEIIIMMQGRANHAGQKEEILSLPSLALTPAGRDGGFVLVNGRALGFGPGMPELVRELHGNLYSKADRMGH
jgi:iron complex transport system substrate-binding protein